MNFKKMDIGELGRLDLRNLTQEQKEELLLVLESELQRIKAETESVEFDTKITYMQNELLAASSKLFFVKFDLEALQKKQE